jgi:hypothetical protein
MNEKLNYVLQQTFARSFTVFGSSYGALALSCFKYALALDETSKG